MAREGYPGEPGKPSVGTTGGEGGRGGAGGEGDPFGAGGLGGEGGKGGSGDPISELYSALANLGDLESRFGRIDVELNEIRERARKTLVSLENLRKQVDNPNA